MVMVMMTAVVRQVGKERVGVMAAAAAAAVVVKVGEKRDQGGVIRMSMSMSRATKIVLKGSVYGATTHLILNP